jgi:hypothetical protein
VKLHIMLIVWICDGDNISEFALVLGGLVISTKEIFSRVENMA